MPVATPELFWLLAEEVLACVCDALDAESSCGCPCRSCTVVGPPAFDDCCNGQLTVNLERVFVHDNFPRRASEPVFCQSPLAGEYVVTLLRCAPAIKNDGTPPSCEELSTSALEIYTDWYIAERAVVCCLAAKKRYSKFVMGESRSIGPQGGCVGFEIRFTTELPDPPPTLNPLLTEDNERIFTESGQTITLEQ